jgi:hypothetical protein
MIWTENNHFSAVGEFPVTGMRKAPSRAEHAVPGMLPPERSFAPNRGEGIDISTHFDTVSPRFACPADGDACRTCAAMSRSMPALSTRASPATQAVLIRPTRIIKRRTVLQPSPGAQQLGNLAAEKKKGDLYDSHN